MNDPRNSQVGTKGQMMKTIEGGCLCGAVRYVAHAEPLVVRQCWCRVCQYLAAGSATINAALPSEAVKVSGVLTDYASIADSGCRMHRRFCGICGVHLFSLAEERPHLITIRVGTFDHPEAAAPQANIWTDSAPKWAHLDPDQPTFTGQPPAPQTSKV